MTDSKNFRIELDGGTPDGELLKFVPGDPISGRVVFSAEKDLTVHALTITITWRTTGKGNTAEADEPVLSDTWTLEQDQQKITSGQSLVRKFQAALPLEPWSYTGRIVSINWSVTATLDVPWAKDPRIIRPFLLKP